MSPPRFWHGDDKSRDRNSRASEAIEPTPSHALSTSGANHDHVDTDISMPYAGLAGRGSCHSQSRAMPQPEAKSMKDRVRQSQGESTTAEKLTYCGASSESERIKNNSQDRR